MINWNQISCWSFHFVIQMLGCLHMKLTAFEYVEYIETKWNNYYENEDVCRRGVAANEAVMCKSSNKS